MSMPVRRTIGTSETSADRKASFVQGRRRRIARPLDVEPELHHAYSAGLHDEKVTRDLMHLKQGLLAVVGDIWSSRCSSVTGLVDLIAPVHQTLTETEDLR